MILVFFVWLFAAVVAWILGGVLVMLLVPAALLIGLPFLAFFLIAQGCWRALNAEPRPLPRCPPPPRRPPPPAGER